MIAPWVRAPGSGLVFGFQAERCFDFSHCLSPDSRLAVAAIRSANKVGDTIGAGQPKGWTKLAERPRPSSVGITMPPYLDRPPNCETGRIARHLRRAGRPSPRESLPR